MLSFQAENKTSDIPLSFSPLCLNNRHLPSLRFPELEAGEVVAEVGPELKVEPKMGRLVERLILPVELEKKERQISIRLT